MMMTIIKNNWNGVDLEVANSLDEDGELEINIVERADDSENDHYVSTWIPKTDIKFLIQHLINIISD